MTALDIVLELARIRKMLALKMKETANDKDANLFGDTINQLYYAIEILMDTHEYKMNEIGLGTHFRKET